jgi:hypothetical protein
MKKALKILFYIILVAVIIFLVAGTLIFVKYKNVEKANNPVRIEKMVVNPATGKVSLGGVVETIYKLQVPWDKMPTKFTAIPGKGSQIVGTPELIREKFGWGCNIWTVNCGIQPFVNGKIPSGSANIIISPDVHGFSANLKVQLPKIFSERIPIAINSLNVATTMHEETTEIESYVTYYIIVGVFILLVLVFGLLIYLKKRKKKVIILSSWSDALLKLNNLKRRLKNDRFDAEKCITYLTDIVRSYLEARFNILASKQTTEEFLKDMESGNSPLTNKDRNFLREFMVTADMIKFARLDISEKQVDTAIDRAEELVKETIPGEK